MTHPPPCLYQCSLLIDNAVRGEDEDKTWLREQVAGYPRHAGYATETVPPTGETSDDDMDVGSVDSGTLAFNQANPELLFPSWEENEEERVAEDILQARIRATTSDDEPTYISVTGSASQPTESFTQLPLPPPPPPAGGSSRGVMPPPGPPPLPDQPNLASGGAGPEVMPPSGARPLPDSPSWTVPPEVNIVGELGDPAAHIAAARAGGNPMGSFTGLIAHGSQIQAHQVAAAAAAISAQEVQAAQNVLASAAQPAASTDDSGQPSEMPHLASATQPAAYSGTGSVTPQPAPLQAHQDAAAAAAILRSGRCCIS